MAMRLEDFTLPHIKARLNQILADALLTLDVSPRPLPKKNTFDPLHRHVAGLATGSRTTHATIR
jgi:hypothetical protein